MTAITFDTHAFVKKLTQAGMPEPQAEILAEEQTRLIEERLASKRDLLEMETRIRTELANLENRLTLRMGGIAAVTVAALAAIKFFGH